MKKSFLVSSDLKIFIVLRSLLTGALVSLLIFFLYLFFSKTLLIPILIFLFFFNAWIFYLTSKNLHHFSALSLELHESHLEFREGDVIKKIFWNDIQRVEMTSTPVGTRNTLVLFTKSENFPLHIYDDFNLLWFQISDRLGRSANIVSRVKIWGKELQLLFATVLSFLLLVFLGTLAVQPSDFNFIYFLALVAGLFFILYRPISQLLSEGITQAEVGIGTVAVLIFMFHFFSTVLVPYLEKGQDAMAACGSESPQIRCYSAPASTCRHVWTQFETACKEELKPWLQSRSPSSLVGPAIQKCQKQKFDKTLFYSRVRGDSSYCQSYFDSFKERTR
jgi:hypothetical protein